MESYHDKLKVYNALIRGNDKINDQDGKGLKLSGQGWKKGLGGTLVAYGLAGGLGSLKTSNTSSGLIGGAILVGVGSYLIHKERTEEKNKKRKGIDFEERRKQIEYKQDKHTVGKGIDKFMNKHLKQCGCGKSKKEIDDFIRKHKDVKISVRDVFGKDWKSKGKMMMEEIKKHHDTQDGSGVWKKIKKGVKKGYKEAKKVRDKSYHELKAWANGERKFKPSHLLDITAGVVGLAGAASALIPGVDLISVPTATAASLGLKSAAHILKTTGRGIKIPKKYLELMKKRPDVLDIIEARMSSIQRGKGIMETFSDLGKIAKVIADFVRWINSSGITMSALRNASYSANLAANYYGSGLSLSGSGLPDGCTKMANGKIKCDKYSVWAGIHKKTKGGLTKKDLIKKGRRVISRKKHLQGKKNYQNGKGIHKR